MSNRCDAFDPKLDGVLQQCVLPEGHSGPIGTKTASSSTTTMPSTGGATAAYAVLRQWFTGMSVTAVTPVTAPDH